MLIGDADAGDLLHYVHEVVSYDIVQDEFALLPEVYRVEIFGRRREVVAGAGATGWLKPEILDGDEPAEREQVRDDHVRTHHVEHTLLAL